MEHGQDLGIRERFLGYIEDVIQLGARRQILEFVRAVLAFNPPVQGVRFHDVRHLHQLVGVLGSELRELAGVHHVLLRDALDPETVLGAEIGVVDHAPQDQGIGPLQEGEEGIDLGVELGARDDGDQGHLGIVDPVQIFQFCLHEEAGVGRQVLVHPHRGGVRLPGAEGIVHEDVGETRQLIGEALCGLALGLFALEPAGVGQVDGIQLVFLQLPDQVVDGGLDAADAFAAIGHEVRDLDGDVQLALQVIHDWLDRGVVLDVNLAGLLIQGAAYMGHEDDLPALGIDVVQRPDGGVDAVGIVDQALLHYVMIHPDQDHFAPEIGVLDELDAGVGEHASSMGRGSAL